MRKKVRIIEVSQDEEEPRNIANIFNKLNQTKKRETPKRKKNTPKKEETPKAKEEETHNLPFDEDEDVLPEENTPEPEEEEEKSVKKQTKKRSNKIQSDTDLIDSVCKKAEPEQCFNYIWNLLQGNKSNIPEKWRDITLTIPVLNEMIKVIHEALSKMTPNKFIQDIKDVEKLINLIEQKRSSVAVKELTSILRKTLVSSINQGLTNFIKQYNPPGTIKKDYSLTVTIYNGNKHVSLTDKTGEIKDIQVHKEYEKSKEKYFIVTFKDSTMPTILTGKEVGNSLIMTGSEIQHYLHFINIAGINRDTKAIYYYYNYDIYKKSSISFWLYKCSKYLNMRDRYVEFNKYLSDSGRFPIEDMFDEDKVLKYLRKHRRFTTNIFIPSRGTILDIRLLIGEPKDIYLFSEIGRVKLTQSTLDLIINKKIDTSYTECLNKCNILFDNNILSKEELFPTHSCSIDVNNNSELKKTVNTMRSINAKINQVLSDNNFIVNDLPTLTHKDKINPKFYDQVLNIITSFAGETIPPNEKLSDEMPIYSNTDIEAEVLTLTTMLVMPQSNTKYSCDRVKKAMHVLKGQIPEIENIQIFKINETDCGASFDVDDDTLNNKEYAIARILQEYNLYAVSK